MLTTGVSPINATIDIIKNHINGTNSSCSSYNDPEYLDIRHFIKVRGLKPICPVGRNRKLTTAYLTLAALNLPSGDFVETGVFSGGTFAIMSRILMKYDLCERKLWAFDSFEGLPEIEPEDHKGAFRVGIPGQYKNSEERFISNLRQLDAWHDGHIVVAKGWFNDTCEASAVTAIAFLRLDGDLFTSTWDAIEPLYDRVVSGGFIYVDDYGSFNGCKAAIDKFRTERGITDTMHPVQENKNLHAEAVWWRKW